MGVYEQEERDDGTKTGITQVGEGPCAESGYYGKETGYDQVGRGTRVDAGTGEMEGGSVTDWDDGVDGSGYQGWWGGVSREAGKAEV